MEISDDLWNEIIKDLDMFNVSKLGLVHPHLHELCSHNDIWESHYNNLFDRRIITSDAKHVGPVNWVKCRCIPYPGWSNIYNEIDNSNFVCKKIDHYENIGTKTLKKKYKNYKLQTKKRYIQLLKKDYMVTHHYITSHEQRKAAMDIQVLSQRLSRLSEQCSEYNKAMSIITNNE